GPRRFRDYPLSLVGLVRRLSAQVLPQAVLGSRKRLRSQKELMSENPLFHRAKLPRAWISKELRRNYPARIRTWTKRAKISCATVTLPGKPASCLAYSSNAIVFLFMDSWPRLRGSFSPS